MKHYWRIHKDETGIYICHLPDNGGPQVIKDKEEGNYFDSREAAQLENIRRNPPPPLIKEKEFERLFESNYYRVVWYDGGFSISRVNDEGSTENIKDKEEGNYFHTKKQALEAIESGLITYKSGINIRNYNVGKSNYSEKKIQPWDIWIEYNLNPWDADIIKRVLRTKGGESRKLEYEKIIHICKERIRQINNNINN